MMGGIVGRLFREFAVTLSTSIVVSMVISLTTTPMMCAYLLRSERGEKHGRLFTASERVFDWVLSAYRGSLHWVLAHPVLTLTVLFLTIALNVLVIVKIPKGFFPWRIPERSPGPCAGRRIRLSRSMNNAIQQIGGVIKKDPGVANVIAFTGGGGATNTGNIYVALKPLAERNVQRLPDHQPPAPPIEPSAGASAFLQAAQDLRIGGRSSNAMYQYTIQADNVKDLSKWGPILLDKMKHLHGLQDVSSDQQDGGLDELMTYDRVTAAKLGLTAQIAGLGALRRLRPIGSVHHLHATQSVLRGAGSRSAVLAEPGRVERHLPSFVRRTATFRCAPWPQGQANTTPLAVNHTGLFPSVTVSFNLAPNVSLSDATASIDQMQKQLGTPSTMQGFFAGTLQAYQQSLGTEPILILTALLAVYIVLGILYESLVHPLTIISTLPSASVGAMLALMLFKEDLNIISIIGIVLLIGIVKKNAIMMIDFALQAERLEGKSPADSIFEACMLRFRPIMMTTMAALVRRSAPGAGHWHGI